MVLVGCVCYVHLYGLCHCPEPTDRSEVGVVCREAYDTTMLRYSDLMRNQSDGGSSPRLITFVLLGKNTFEVIAAATVGTIITK